MKCGDCINYGTCSLTCNVVRTSDICSCFLGGLSCNGCKYDNDRFSDICYHDCIMFSGYEKEHFDKPIIKDESISCSNCINDDEDGCRVACIRKEHFSPKEKPMKNKVIFEDVQQMLDFMNDCIYGKTTQTTIILAKEKGYIRKSVVEEAEDMYERTVFSYKSDMSELAKHLYEAIQELKAGNDRLKKLLESVKGV